MKYAVALAVVLAVILGTCVANATSILWTGYANNNQWNTATNWYPAQIPSSGDDVTIHTGNVQATTGIAVNSLLMGDHLEGKANLTIFNSFDVFTTLKCYQNGNIILSAGSSALSGQVTVQGGLSFASGSVSGDVTVTGTADLSGAAAKTVTGGALALNGASKIGGVVTLTQAGNLNVAGTVAISTSTIIESVNNTKGGFDFSKGTLTLTSDLSVQSAGSFGSLTYTSGNITIYDQVTFANTLNIPANWFVVTVGSAAVNVQLAGSGGFVSNGASSTFGSQSFDGLVACEGASCTFSGKTNSVNNLVAGSGTVKVSSGCAFSSAFINIVNAQFSNAGSAETKQLNFLGNGVVAGGSIKATNFYSKIPNTFTVDGSITVSTAANFGAGTINFGQSGTISLAKGSQSMVSGALAFSGPPNAPGFTNNGNLTVKAGVTSTNINFAGAGTVSASGVRVTISGAEFAAGTLQLASGASLVGTNGCVNIATLAASVVKAKIDKFSFDCNGSCTNVVAPCSPMPTDSFSFSS